MSSDNNTASLTKKQQYWHDHIQQAKASNETLSDYANQHGLDVKALYNYRWLLRRKGLLGQSTVSPAFVKVTQPATPVQHATVTIRFPNGMRVDVSARHDDFPLLLNQVKRL